MMDIIYTYPLYALIVSNAVLLFAAAVAILRFERLIKEYRSFWNSPTGVSMRENSNPEGVLTGFIEHRLALIHDRIDDLARQEVPANKANSAELPYDYAARMAKHGASIEDLTRSCGLNKAEAHLVRRLHARKRSSKQSPTH